MFRFMKRLRIGNLDIASLDVSSDFVALPEIFGHWHYFYRFRATDAAIGKILLKYVFAQGGLLDTELFPFGKRSDPARWPTLV